MLKVAIVNVSLYIRGNNSKKNYWDKASASPKEEIVLLLLIIEGAIFRQEVIFDLFLFFNSLQNLIGQHNRFDLRSENGSIQKVKE